MVTAWHDPFQNPANGQLLGLISVALATSPRCEIGSSRGQPLAEAPLQDVHPARCPPPNMCTGRATLKAQALGSKLPAQLRLGTRGAAALSATAAELLLLWLDAATHCVHRTAPNQVQTEPRPCPTCDPPRSPSRPFPFLEIPSSCTASRREPQNPDNWTRPFESRSDAPQDWRGARAPLRMCALRTAESHATPPSDSLPPSRSDTTRAVGNFLNLARTRSPPHPRRLGVRPESRRAGPDRCSSCAAPARVPGRGRRRQGRAGPRGEAVGVWRGAAGGGRPGTLAHAPGKLPVALPSPVLS